MPTVLLVGNPNVGKSVIFGHLTKSYVVVSNYPGTTVEVARGRAALSSETVSVVDLPGVNNLIPQSEDEAVTRNVLIEQEAQIVLQVADAKNLRRALLVSLAVGEMGLPTALVLNMMDEALSRGVRIDRRELARRLGIPVLVTVAHRGKGLQHVRRVVAEGGARPEVAVDYGGRIESAVEELIPLLPEGRVSRRALALMILAGDEDIREWMQKRLPDASVARIGDLRRRLRADLRRPIAHEITRARVQAATEILTGVYRVDPALRGAVERIARFGDTVAGRGVAHVSSFLGTALLLFSLGGFAPSVPGVAVAAALIALAVVFGRRRRSTSLVLLGTVAGIYLLGVLLGPLADLFAAEAWFRSPWVQAFAALLVAGGVLLGGNTMNLTWGTIGAFAVLYLTYLFVGVLGAGDLVDFFEGTVFGGYVSPFLKGVVDAVLPPAGTASGTWGDVAGFLNAMLVGEYGALTMALSYSVAILLPIVGTFFLVFGILEDSGYLPRLAVMMNRAFRAIGLNGKAVLPMVLGLGCDTMATLTTRVLETKKERVIVTLLLALAIPCSAQLGVILGITGQIGSTAMLWWVGTVLVVLIAVGWLSSKLLPGRPSDFILELPPLRVPRLSNITMKTLARIEWYLKEAVPIFFLGTLVLFLLDATGLLEPLKWAASPVVTGVLGLPEDATPPLLIGFLRRDYGAAGLADLWRQGLLDPRQAVVALVTVTLFVPCIANFFVMIKERGFRSALLMVLFIFPMAFVAGGIVNLLLGLFEVFP